MKRSYLILVALIVILGGVWIYLARPIYLAQAHSPHPRGGEIRIAELPSAGPLAFLIRDNPRYRFEYLVDDGYVWTSATFVGESYQARTGKIFWEKDSRAICYLDDIPIFILNGRLFEKYSEHGK
jgi:hypothetical protein